MVYRYTEEMTDTQTDNEMPVFSEMDFADAPELSEFAPTVQETLSGTEKYGERNITRNAAYVALNSEPEHVIDTFRNVKRDLKKGDSRPVVESEERINVSNQNELRENGYGTVLRMMDEGQDADTAVQSFLVGTERKDNSRTQFADMQFEKDSPRSAFRDNQERDSVWLRNHTQALEDRQAAQQVLESELWEETESSGLVAAAGFTQELLLSFVPYASEGFMKYDIAELKDKVVGADIDQSYNVFISLAQDKQATSRWYNTLPPAKQREVAPLIAQAWKGDRLALDGQNDIVMIDRMEALDPNYEPDLDELVGLIANVPAVGGLVKKGLGLGKAAKVRKVMRNNKVKSVAEPTSPMATADLSNETSAKNMYDAVQAGNDEVANALTGQTKNDALNGNVLPLAPAEDIPRVTQKPHERGMEKFQRELDKAFQYSGDINLTRVEKDNITTSLMNETSRRIEEGVDIMDFVPEQAPAKVEGLKAKADAPDLAKAAKDLEKQAGLRLKEHSRNTKSGWDENEGKFILQQSFGRTEQGSLVVNKMDKQGIPHVDGIPVHTYVAQVRKQLKGTDAEVRVMRMEGDSYVPVKLQEVVKDDALLIEATYKMDKSPTQYMNDITSGDVSLVSKGLQKVDSVLPVKFATQFAHSHVLFDLDTIARPASVASDLTSKKTKQLEKVITPILKRYDNLGSDMKGKVTKEIQRIAENSKYETMDVNDAAYKLRLKDELGMSEDAIQTIREWAIFEEASHQALNKEMVQDYIADGYKKITVRNKEGGVQHKFYARSLTEVTPENIHQYRDAYAISKEMGGEITSVDQVMDVLKGMMGEKLPGNRYYLTELPTEVNRAGVRKLKRVLVKESDISDIPLHEDMLKRSYGRTSPSLDGAPTFILRDGVAYRSVGTPANAKKIIQVLNEKLPQGAKPYSLDFTTDPALIRKRMKEVENNTLQVRDTWNGMPNTMPPKKADPTAMETRMDGDVALPNPLESLQRNTRFLANKTGMADYVRTAKSRWSNTYKELYGGEAPDILPWNPQDVPDIGNASLRTRAINELEYIQFMEANVAPSTSLAWKHSMTKLVDSDWAQSTTPMESVKAGIGWAVIKNNPLAQLSYGVMETLSTATVNPTYVMNPNGLAKDAFILNMMDGLEKAPKKVRQGVKQALANNNVKWEDAKRLHSEWKENAAVADMDSTIAAQIGVRDNAMKAAGGEISSAHKLSPSWGMKAGKAALNVGSKVGVEAGEYMIQMSTWLAYRNRKMKDLKTKTLTKDNLLEVNADVREFTGNMNRSGAMGIQRGAMGVPFMFMHTVVRFLWRAVNKGRMPKTTREIADLSRLWAYSTVMFGGAHLFPEATNEKIPEFLRNTWNRGWMQMGLNSVWEYATGEEDAVRSEVGEQFAPIPSYAAVYDPTGQRGINGLISTFWDGGMSEVNSSLGVMVGKGKDLFDIWNHSPSLAEMDETHYTAVMDKLAQMASTGYSNFVKSQIALETGKAKSLRTGMSVDNDVSTPEAYLKVLGVMTEKESDTWEAVTSLSRTKKEVKADVKDFVDGLRVYLVAQDDLTSDEDKAVERDALAIIAKTFHNNPAAREEAEKQIGMMLKEPDVASSLIQSEIVPVSDLRDIANKAPLSEEEREAVNQFLDLSQEGQEGLEADTGLFDLPSGLTQSLQQ